MLHKIKDYWKILKNLFYFTDKSNTDINQSRDTLSTDMIKTVSVMFT
jgi:hypothetical protein